mmetsp:Transcript_71331/g.189760  ORF Transcript_71331/g.189760 Transcript_71331/m.189760 type:complete len:1192 (-) Transcript_71331:531-4106(-)
MPPGQITGLLGANGAGKTTTISMLTGLITPSAGDAILDGKSIRSQMDEIRRSLGVCPQLNVIFEGLTPTQHLHLYGALKGLSGVALTDATDRMLEQVKLSERAHTNSDSLSGGQKRKLCLGISLIGGPRTIFLDEPTSGMDPYSRRAIWQLLREKREGRTIVLTTHFLDEAELLSDRIAIMAEGRLCCVGSSLFLKAQYGVGYSLSLIKATDGSFDKANFLSFIGRLVPNIRVISDTAIEFVAQVPGDDLGTIKTLLEALEGSLAKLGVAEYGATCTTLEDVFLKINETSLERLAKQENEREGGAAKPDVAPSISVEAPSNTNRVADTTLSIASEEIDAAMVTRSTKSTMATFASLVTKRRLSSRRDCCTTTCQLLFPVVLVFFALALLNVSSRIVNTGETLQLSPAAVFTTNGVNVWSGPVVPQPAPLVVADDPLALSLAPSLAAQGWAAAAANCSTDDAFPLAAVNLSNYLFAHPSTDVLAGLTYADGSLPLPSLPLPLSLPLTESPAAFTSLLFNSSAIHALPALVNSVFDARVAAVSGNQSSISAVSNSLPVSKTRKATIAAFVSVFASIMILIPFAFVGASFVTALVRERESGSKQMQFVAGVKGLTYWMANWTWDAIMYLLVICGTLIAFRVAGRDEFTGSAENFGATTLILILFGFAALPLSSAVSFLFKTPSSGLIAMIAFYFLSGFGLVIANFILSSVVESTRDISKSLQWVYRLFPAYNLGAGFYTLSTRSAFVQAGTSDVSLYGFSCSADGSYCPLGAPLLYLFLEGLAFGALTLVLQSASSQVGTADQNVAGRMLRWLGTRMQGDTTPLMNTRPVQASGDEGGSAPRLPSIKRTTSMELEDDSVVAERAAIDGGEASGQLVIKHLRKVYGGLGGKTAVRDLCLRINTGECFGFLGVNGAGKSTTFSMLTGAVPPTSGDALLNNMSILTQQDAIRKEVGYCPQHDALEHLMTGRETLRMYANIKQVPSLLIEAEVDGLINDLDLAKFADKPCGQYSGGNKRKLCVGIALVGSPQLVLLDEPSSGMDAASKRFLWTVIKRRTANCCTVLTTHSMEECEALCGRIGVMVDGALRCLGTIQSLKNTYGSGYKLDLRLDPEASKPDEVLAFLQESCGGQATLEELEPPVMTVTVPSDAATLPALFGRLAQAKEVHQVKECSVTTATLEQIFIAMASKSAMRSST